MSWNDNAGGGSNNGQNPWGNRPTGGGGQEPPDLDEVVREMQNKMRGVFGGGGWMGLGYGEQFHLLRIAIAKGATCGDLRINVGNSGLKFLVG